MTVVFRYAARSHAGLGRGRDLNEDSGYAGPRLLAVADGMGGHVAGEVASALTIAAIQPLDAPPTSQRPDPLAALAWAVKQANTRIAEWIRTHPSAKGMGTTLTALLMYGDRQLGLVHIGDCRAYLLRRGAMRRISRDHTLLQSLIDEGKLTPEQAEVHPQRSMITRAMQGNDDEKARPDVYTEQVEIGDRLLVCSDGLIDAPVPDHVIADTLDAHSHVDQAAAALVDLALRAGAPDNVTCVVADVVKNTKSRRRSAPPTTPILVGAVAAPNPAFGAPAAPMPGQGPAAPATPSAPSASAFQAPQSYASPQAAQSQQTPSPQTQAPQTQAPQAQAPQPSHQPQAQQPQAAQHQPPSYPPQSPQSYTGPQQPHSGPLPQPPQAPQAYPPVPPTHHPQAYQAAPPYPGFQGPPPPRSPQTSPHESPSGAPQGTPSGPMPSGSPYDTSQLPGFPAQQAGGQPADAPATPGGLPQPSVQEPPMQEPSDQSDQEAGRQPPAPPSPSTAAPPTSWSPSPDAASEHDARHLNNGHAQAGQAPPSA